MKTHLFALACALLIGLTGCVHKKTADAPFTTMATAETASAAQWRTGYEWVTPESETPVMLVADYRHVLTTAAPTVYSAPPENESPAEKPVDSPTITQKAPEPPPERSVIILSPKPSPLQSPPVEIKTSAVPVQTAQKTRILQPTIPSPIPVETSEDRAWRRFCDNGDGMTSDDMSIIMAADGKIPAKFEKECFPPK